VSSEHDSCGSTFAEGADDAGSVTFTVEVLPPGRPHPGRGACALHVDGGPANGEPKGTGVALTVVLGVGGEGRDEGADRVTADPVGTCEERSKHT